MEIPVVCISSIGRDSYNKRIANNSYKESGNLEFSAGVNLGWNWYGGNVNPNDKDKAMLDKFKREGCRLMEFDFLKSRDGERDTRARFNYNPAHNYFEEIRD